MKSILSSKKIIVVAGTGGVGKTSISAALAIAAADKLGIRVGLVTIDPAKRLASALGLNKLETKPKSISAQVEKALERKLSGSIHALMFDPSQTLDSFVKSTGGKELLEEMKRNQIYQVIASNFSGLSEFLALEKLHELETTGSYDLILLDTPPARHTLDFLDAPDRIASFFDDRIFQWFLTKPSSTRLIERLRARGTKAAFQLLEKITGEGVIRDFMRIAPHLKLLKDSFLERQGKIRHLLTGEESGAVFVTTALQLSQRDLSAFWQDAKKRNLQPLALVLNRSLRDIAPTSVNQAEAKLDPEFFELYRSLRKIVKIEELRTISVKEQFPGDYPVVIVPELLQNIHGIKGLDLLVPHLLGDKEC